MRWVSKCVWQCVRLYSWHADRHKICYCLRNAEAVSVNETDRIKREELVSRWGSEKETLGKHEAFKKLRICTFQKNHIATTNLHLLMGKLILRHTTGPTEWGPPDIITQMWLFWIIMLMHMSSRSVQAVSTHHCSASKQVKSKNGVFITA